ncbi:MAG: murein L,D-transpeptidase [Chlorobium sp.]|nr:MAG: murein L,D-transpeptidase [Chlorobium sp.]
MIGILLLWFAFSPFQLIPVKPAPSRPELKQPEKKRVVDSQQMVVRNGTADRIRAHFDRLLQQTSSEGNTERARFNARFARFYKAIGFKPLWTKRVMVEQLIKAVEESADDGLDPSDYHLAKIRKLFNTPPETPQQEACYDLLLSDAFLTLAGHLRYGKVDPERIDPNWNINDLRSNSALDKILQHAIVSEQIDIVLKKLRPQHPGYVQLKKGLAKYRTIAREGGWPVQPEGTKLQEGVRDVRVTLLRQRLIVSGDIAALPSDTSMVYTRDLVEAVRRFQKRSGLDTDGVVGAATRRVMNIPVEKRIEQIRINLERYRWVLNDLEPTYIMVNIAGFNLEYVENGLYRWGARVIVGQPYRETPVFKADMQYIVVNPQWVIPPTVLAKDALPALRKSISYLNQKKLRVIDQKGNIVNPASINWSQYSAANFPYNLLQTAGDNGALGRIKFLLPNRHLVYLHDTPTKDLFEKNTRTFSSGCIRVENPLELAELVLRDSVRWNRSKLQEAVNSGKTKTIALQKRIPVFILYLTAVARGDEILFRDDVYNRDGILLEALNKPVPNYKAESCGF